MRMGADLPCALANFVFGHPAVACLCYAARTDCKNFSTSRLRRLPSPDKAWADVPTCKSVGLDVEYLMLRGIFMAPGVTDEQTAYYVDLLKKVRETPEWTNLMKDGAFNQSFMTGAEYAKWAGSEEERHRALMKEAAFLATTQ